MNFTRVSESMDKLAKAIVDKNKEIDELKKEYERKLTTLDQLLGVITSAAKPPSTDLVVARTPLDEILANGLQTTERDGQCYVLIPVTDKPVSVATNSALEHQISTPAKSNRKKNKKHVCSYCHETGHSKAQCEKRLLGTQ